MNLASVAVGISCGGALGEKQDFLSYPSGPSQHSLSLKVHKIEIFFGFDFEICIISLLVMSNY